METSLESTLSSHHLETICSELGLPQRQVMATALLLKGGATIPFIARYRKEMTGTLDEVAITSIRDRMEALAELDARRESILKSLEERNLLTDELKSALLAANQLNKLEDLYLPYRPKKRTRAAIAKEQGLEPLAELLFLQDDSKNPTAEAEAFVNGEKQVENTDKALAGARDILAERFSDDAEARSRLRELFKREAILSSKVMSDKEAEAAKFKDYFDWQEPVSKAPSHRVLAIRRGEAESLLIMRIQVAEASALSILEPMFVKNSSLCGEQVRLAVQDCYKRLLMTAMETEMRLETKKQADQEAIRVFAENLRELLLASPLGRKNVLAIDPGFRTGCKVVCLDRQGKLLANEVIYPDQSTANTREAMQAIHSMCKQHQIEAIAIGNGTAGRETETFLRKIQLPASLPIIMVNESGASIYSASEVAREEFPNHDITVRGAVSIGRRLMDPLAELVKLDPKSIGVGQYQHDVDQSLLKKSLDDVVISCVNRVGVEVNTASKQLLMYVSGIGPQLAENIVHYRNENGPFSSRQELLKVPRLGAKVFEQASGFLRIQDGKNPLDASAVHPESYPIVETMARDLSCTISDLLKRSELSQKIDKKRYVTDTIGLPTLNDILQELVKPGRDPRQQFEVFSFAEEVHTLKDLQPGMKLPGIVTNVTAFGAFVDIGVHQDGLVHVSQLADQFVKDPAEVVKVQQKVMVTVMEVDVDRKRIALSMKTKPELTGGTSSGKRNESSPRPAGKNSSSHRPTEQASSSFGGDWFAEALKKGKNSKTLTDS